MAEEKDRTGTEETEEQVSEEVQAAMRTKKARKQLVKGLAEERKVQRAQAGKLVHELACQDPELLLDHFDDLIDALDRPEPQTRWEVLGALEEIAHRYSRLLDKAVIPATGSLHDPDSGVVRTAAFRFLATYGSTSKRRAEKVWPLLDEAIRIYHGDQEYPGMLAGLAVFADGRANEDVKEEVALLIEPDASHPKAAIGRRARQVFMIATGGDREPRKRKPGGMAEQKKKKKKKSKGKKADAKGGGKKSGSSKKTAPKKTGSSKKSK